ncbi:hypothetical protein SLEP1_g27563 [Rubroshorea leprosula]|uniref:Uncharacterized protein n=1 Tax=Rubroshorea leprosula TaxID=152421 RepID=A0AAV5JQT7_9ROSI|nr:hypothetical protein SLEP1_g27563 [Rubroshorea leprosula]
MKKRSLGFLLAVLLILLIGEVLEAASIPGGSISTTSIADFIGHEEFLMESDINARLLGAKGDICSDYAALKKPPVKGCYSKHVGNGQPIRCKPEERCRRGTSQASLLW